MWPRSQRMALSPPKILALLLALLLGAGAGGFMMAGMALPFVYAAGTVSNSATGLFNDLPADIEVERPSERSVMLAADGSVLATFFADNRLVVAPDQISAPMVDAIVAVEDRRFYQHQGVDPEGMARALVRNAFADRQEGASTLTQQLVKNLLIERGRVSGDADVVADAIEVSYGRKLREARYAIALEEEYTKEQIVGAYLNIAQFGVSVYGVEAASQLYFSKSAADLTVAEAALLAGIPQAPGRLDPLRHPENALPRRDLVLRDMRDQGYITPAQYEEAAALPIEDMLRPQPIASGCAGAGTAAYFCEYVVKEILSDPTFGETVDQRRTLLLRGGLVIETTLDPTRQQAAFEAVTSTVPINDESNIKMAIASVEPGTGRIQAMAQNTNYGLSATPEDPSRTVVSYAVDRAHGGGEGFQTGSTFKVLVLTQWLRSGHSLADVVAGNKRSYPRDVWNISCAPENRPLEPYQPKNLEGVGGDQVSVLDATRKSINLAYVEMASQLDLCDVAAVAGSMGLDKGNGEPLEIVPSMTLGSNTITPLDMASAFATYAEDGMYCTPIAVSRASSRAGAEYAARPSSCAQVIEPEIARGVNHALRTVTQTGGTGFRAALADRPVAGKTGTANNDYHAWFVGYTPQLAAAVWMGHSEGDVSMEYARINGTRYGQVYGGLLPAPAWHKYMAAAMQGVPVEGFPAATERTVFGDRRPVPNVLGRSLAAATAILGEAGFRVQVGEAVTSGEAAGTVGKQVPGPGSRATLGSVVTVNPSSGAAPRPLDDAEAPPVIDPPALELPPFVELPGGDDGGGGGDEQPAPSPEPPDWWDGWPWGGNR